MGTCCFPVASQSHSSSHAKLKAITSPTSQANIKPTEIITLKVEKHVSPNAVNHLQKLPYLNNIFSIKTVTWVVHSLWRVSYRNSILFSILNQAVNRFTTALYL